MAQFVLLFVVAVVGFAGCTEDAADGCSQDTDCKGTRICEMRRCVEPGSLDGGRRDASLDAGMDAATDASRSDAGERDAGMNATPDANATDASIDGATNMNPDTGLDDASVGDAGGWEIPLIDGGDYLYYMGVSAYYDVDWEGSPTLALDNTIDGMVTHNLPFAFTYFGTTYAAGTPVTVTSNGTLWFEQASVSGTNTTLPQSAGPHGVIAAFWDQTRMEGGGIRFIDLADALHIEFINPSVSTVTGPPWITRTTTYVLSLMRDGRIQIRYHGGTWPTPTTPPMFSATIGIESPDGTGAVSLDCSPICSPPQGGTVLTFVPKSANIAGPDVMFRRVSPALPTDAYPTERVTLRLEGINRGDLIGGGTVWVLFTSVDPPKINLDEGFGPNVQLGVPGHGVRWTEDLEIPLGVVGARDIWAWFEDDDLFPQNNLFKLGTVTVHPYLGDILITTPSPLPMGQVGTPYSTQLQATGATNVTWSTGSALPAGVTLSPSGLLSGTPTETYAREFYVTADSYGYRPQSLQLGLVVQ